MIWRLTAVILPVILGMVSVLFLVQSRILDFSISLPADLDVIVILTGVGLSSFIALRMAMREGYAHLREQNVKQLRKDALAEHLRFLRRLDHELKNPLLAIHAELANLIQISEAPEQQETIQRIEAQLQRISRLITDLRKLVELETVTLEASDIDLGQLLHEALSLIRDRQDAQERRLILALPHASDLPLQFHGDQDLLLLALHNLLDNAVKYTRSGDTVKLQAYPQNDSLIIEIIDTGIGIPETEQPLVWEELYRGRSVDTIHGTGIGLALALAVIERHHGEIDLESEVGKGTTVRIRLPRTAPVSKPEQRSSIL